MYKVNIQLATGWHEMQNYSLEGCSLVRYRHDETLRQRDKLTGNVKFFGDDATLLAGQTAYYLNCQVITDSQIVLYGRFAINRNYDINEHYIILTFDENDNYTNILRDIDKDFGARAKGITLPYTTYLDVINYGAIRDATVPTPTDYSLCDLIYTVPNWDSSIAYIAANEIVQDEVWEGKDIDTTFARFAGLNYVAVRANVNSEPSLTNADWVNILDVSIFKQERSDYFIDGWAYEEDLQYYYTASCTTRGITVILNGYDLFLTLSYIISGLGYTVDKDNYLNYIKDNYPDQVGVLVYYGEAGKELSLKDCIDIYKYLFNVEWVLDGNEFMFKHPSEVNLAVPEPYASYPAYYIDRNLGKDWSSSRFIADVKTQIYKEEFKAGKSEDDIIYDTPFEDVFTRELAAEFDISYGLQEANDVERVICFYTGTTATEIVQVDQITEHYNYDRPYAIGEINGIEYEFVKSYTVDCTITIPYSRQNLIDFDYLIKTSFGDLRVNEINVNLQNANSTIKAASQ